MARTLVAGPDAFTAADSTNVSTYNSTNWAEQNGSTAFLRIFSNSFRNDFTNRSDNCWKGAGVFTDDQYFELAIIGTWSINDTDEIGGTLRNNGAAFGSETMYRVFWSPALNGLAGAVQVFKIVAGNNSHNGTQLGSNVNFGMASGDLLSAEAVTNGANVDILVYKNNVLQGTVSDTASVLTGGKPGITGKKNAGFMFGDDWTAGNVTGVTNASASVTGASSTVSAGTVATAPRPPVPYTLTTVTG